MFILSIIQHLTYCINLTVLTFSLIASLGIYAVATRQPLNSSTITRCSQRRTTLACMPPKSPFVTMTWSPNLYWMLSNMTGII